MSFRDLAITSAILLAGPAAAFAQEAAPSIESPADQYSDAEVDAFAEAIGAAAEVNDQWRPRIDAAASPEEAQQLTRQSQTEMAAAIESTGISIDDYNEIYESAQIDQRLAERIGMALQKRSQARPAG